MASLSKNLLNDEARYRLLKLLDENPETSQRELAKTLDISLGKANYCIRALIDRGWVKVENFRNGGRKVVHLYKLTPKGLAEKALVTRNFLGHKLREIEQLEYEIAALKIEINDLDMQAN